MPASADETAQAQRVDASTRELEQEALADVHAMPSCTDCRWTGGIRAPTTSFIARKKRDAHASRTGHDVELVELSPSEVARLRDQFRFDIEVQDAARDAYQRAAVEAEQAPEDATPQEIGQAIRNLHPEVRDDG